MFNVFSKFIIQGIKIQNGRKVKLFLVCYIGRYDILKQTGICVTKTARNVHFGNIKFK